MNITVQRLKRVVEVIHFWNFFLEGFHGIERKARESFDLDQMQKTLYHHVKLHDNCFVAIAFSDKQPVGFIVMEEATPMFAAERSCIARAVYHRPTVPALLPMMDAFETWAKKSGFKHYVITTRRHTGSAVRFFQSPKFGFRRGYITFEKTIA